MTTPRHQQARNTSRRAAIAFLAMTSVVAGCNSAETKDAAPDAAADQDTLDMAKDTAGPDMSAADVVEPEDSSVPDMDMRPPPDARDPDLPVDMPIEELQFAVGSVAPFAAWADSDRIEVISGFQGGYHIEPVIKAWTPDGLAPMAVVGIDLTRTSDAQRIAGGVWEMPPDWWTEDGDGWLVYPPPLVFEIPREDALGQASLAVDVTVGSQVWETTLAIELIDEVEEFGGGGDFDGLPPDAGTGDQ